MSAPPAVTERYNPDRHDASKFESRNEALDRWLIRYAGQSERRDAARTFVIADTDVVIGYFALLAASSTTTRRPNKPARACHATSPSQ